MNHVTSPPSGRFCCILWVMPRKLNRATPEIFIPAAIVTVVALAFVWWYGGLAGFLTALTLVIIEITFSFDNAIVNAKTLGKMTAGWQRAFMTAGIVIAVFGMRILFPLLIVMLSTGRSIGDVVHMALYVPRQYAAVLEAARPSIAAFGGLFLLTLSLDFFLDKSRDVHWLAVIERPLQRVSRRGAHIVISIFVLLLIALLPVNHHVHQTLLAGMMGIATYVAISGVTKVMDGAMKRAKNGAKTAFMIGLSLFLYLEILDASFSFDGVIGAFAVTDDIILIAIGLGVGAYWIRSLTLYIVHRRVLNTYRYLEHAAHYVIGALALSLLIGLFIALPEMAVGLLGVGVIAASVVSSMRVNNKELHDH